MAFGIVLQAERAWPKSSGGGNPGAYPAFKVYAPLSIMNVFSGNDWTFGAEACAEVRGLVEPILSMKHAKKIFSIYWGLSFDII